jgi:hypothetical protein
MGNGPNDVNVIANINSSADADVADVVTGQGGGATRREDAMDRSTFAECSW